MTMEPRPGVPTLRRSRISRSGGSYRRWCDTIERQRQTRADGGWARGLGGAHRTVRLNDLDFRRSGLNPAGCGGKVTG